MTTACRSASRSLLAAAFFVTLFALSPSEIFAQGKNNKEPTPEEKKGYTMPYFFTAIGILAVSSPLCWPALRKWDVPAADDE